MRNLLYTILLGLSVHLTGCGDYLDVVPKNDIQTIETIFEKREDAYHWLRSCYIMLTPHIAEFLNNFAVRLAFCDSMYYNEA